MLLGGDYYPPVYLWWVLFSALLLDGLVGDPAWLYRRILHPVALMGRGFGFLEARFNNASDTVFVGVVKGGLCLLVLLTVFVGLSLLIFMIEDREWRFVVEVLFVSIFLAQNSLYRHVLGVLKPLEQENLALAQQALQCLVSRDASRLDSLGVGGSAIESLAENFSDSVMSVVFWYILFGLPGVVFYKAVNTGDSMWGYRSRRYESFGKAVARLDDFCNFFAARLSVLLVALASGRHFMRVFCWAWRDGSSHDSVNAGWVEAAFAAALDIVLGGERYYDGIGFKRGVIGSGVRITDSFCVRDSLRFYLRVCFILWFIVLSLSVAVLFGMF